MPRFSRWNLPFELDHDPAKAVLYAAIEGMEKCRQSRKLDLIRLELLGILQESGMAFEELVDLLQLYVELLAQIRPHGEGDLPSS